MHQFYLSWHFGFIFWFQIAFGMLTLLTLSHLISGKWSATLRPLYAAGARSLPVFILLFIPIVIGRHEIFHHWMKPIEELDPILLRKEPYLNETFFFIRAAMYFTILWFVSRPLTRETYQSAGWAGMDPFAAPAMILIALVGTFASIDWVMSLEPHWFSTIFGVIFVIGSMLSAHVFTILVVAFLRRRNPDPLMLSPKRVHDLGTLTFAFLFLWAYMTISQFLIIWSANIPEEVIWYIPRITHGWGTLAIALVAMQFFFPWLTLLLKFVKRRIELLAVVAGVILITRFFEAFWHIMPTFYPDGFHMHVLDVVAPLIVGGIWLSAFAWQLRRVPMMTADGVEKTLYGPKISQVDEGAV